MSIILSQEQLELNELNERFNNLEQKVDEALDDIEKVFEDISQRLYNLESITAGLKKLQEKVANGEITLPSPE